MERLRHEQFDILVIGGGITGASVAQAAARHGFTTALVEKGDFASGASSRSSKLIHGGLRYLASGQYHLVSTACHERRTLSGLFPNLVKPLPFLLPVYREGRLSPAKMRLAMWLYDGLAAFRNLRPHQVLSVAEALAAEPLLNPVNLLQAALYYDCTTDDARLTLAIVRAAHSQGAVIVNHAEVVGLLRARQRIVGAQVRDRQSGIEVEARARQVIGALGPWTDEFLCRTETSAQAWLRPSKGVHLVVPRRRVFSHAAVTFTVPRDGRFAYLIPWDEHALIGTTETDDVSDPDDVYATAADVAYLLEAANQAFPSARLTETDVVSAYAGVRPLVRDRAGARGRNTRAYRVAEVAPGLTIVAGGKLTLYRPMAQAALHAAARRMPPQRATLACASGARGLEGESGAALAELQGWLATAVEADDLAEDVAHHLMSSYGAALPAVVALMKETPAWSRRLTPGLPIIQAQVIYAVRHEMALTLSDVLDQRTHVLWQADDQGLEATNAAADLMAAELAWTDAERAAQVASYRRTVALTRSWRHG